MDELALGAHRQGNVLHDLALELPVPQRDSGEKRCSGRRARLSSTQGLRSPSGEARWDHRPTVMIPATRRRSVQVRSNLGGEP